MLDDDEQSQKPIQPTDMPALLQELWQPDEVHTQDRIWLWSQSLPATADSTISPPFSGCARHAIEASLTPQKPRLREALLELPMAGQDLLLAQQEDEEREQSGSVWHAEQAEQVQVERVESVEKANGAEESGTVRREEQAEQVQVERAESVEKANGAEERRPVLHAERVVQAKSAEVFRQVLHSNFREEGPARRLEQERQPVLHAESLQAKSAEAMNPGQEERRPVLHAERVVQAKSAEVFRQGLDSNCREEGPARRVEQERQPVLHAESLQAKSAEAMNPGQEERRPVLHAERVVQAKSAEVLRQDSNCREEGPARRLEQERQPVLHAESLRAKSAETMNPGQEERRPVLHAERVVQAKSAEVLRQGSNCREEGPARRVEQERQPVLHAESLQAKSAEAMNPGQEERRPVLHAERVVQAKSAEVLRQDSNCREEGPARRLEQERKPVLHAESLQAKSAEAMNPGQEERRPVLHAERVVQAKSAEVFAKCFNRISERRGQPGGWSRRGSQFCMQSPFRQRAQRR